MKHLFLILFLFILCTVKGQKDSVQLYFGALTLSSGQIISYKLEISTTEDEKVNGVSVTDFYGANITKSAIEGAFTKNGRRLSFREYLNLSTKSDAADSVFCFVAADNLKIRKFQGKKIINGEFYGLFSNNDTCAYGKIYLVSNIASEMAKLDEKLSSFKDSTGVVNFNALKDSISANQDTVSAELKILRHNDLEVIKWSAEEVVVEVWDGSTEDGDKVNVFFDGKLLAKNVTITKKVQTFKIPFSKRKGVLKIEAVDEGKIGINTVNMLFRNGRSLNPYISKLKLGEVVQVEFQR